MSTNNASMNEQGGRQARAPRRILLGLAGTAAVAMLALGLNGGIPALATSGTSAEGGATVATQGSTSGSAATSDSTTLAETVAAKASPSVGTVQAAVRTQQSQGISMGSCVLIDDDGHVLTNYHVIENASGEVKVTFNGVDYDATVLGSDPTSDLAVLEITPDENTPDPIEIGSSSDLALGEWVMTIGSPMGESQSVSQGIVSGLNRQYSYELDTAEAIYTGLIQTDAMINEGSSGGALVNANGELVGITTLSATTTGDWAGMSYAIPGDYAISVARQIIDNGVVEHPYMGVSLADVTPYNYQSAGTQTYWGAYVASVVSGSPAEEAGLQVGDVITEIDGTTVTSTEGAIIATRSHEIGDTVSVTVERDGQSVELEVTLGSDQNGTASGTKVAASDTADESADASDSEAGAGAGGVFSFFGKGSGSNAGNDASGDGASDGGASAGSNANGSDEGANGGWGYGYGDGSNGYGYGYGAGSGGWGYGSGWGYGPGYGGDYGYGAGYGSGYGFGSGYGYGYEGTPTSGTADAGASVM